MSRRRKHSKGWRPPVLPGAEIRGVSALCSHGMMLYPSAAAARVDERGIRGQDPTAKLRPFRCADVDEGWHLGELPAAVVAGLVDADTYFAGNAPASCYPPKERRYA